MQKTETVNKVEKTNHMEGEEPEDEKLKGGEKSEGGEEIQELECKQEDDEKSEIQQEVEKKSHKKDMTEVSEAQEGKESESLREKAKTEEKNTRGLKPKGELMEGEKSEIGKGKVREGEKLKGEEKSAEEERITAVGEKQENEQEKPMEREEMEHRMEVRGGEKGKDKKTGYFVMKRGPVLYHISLTPEMELQYSSNEDEEEGEEIEEEEEEERIDRETAIEKYKSLQAEERPIFKTNFMLLKKLADHLQKHKMEDVYKTSEPYSPDQEVRYHKQLLAFEEIRNAEKNEREAIMKEIKGMKNRKDELVAELKLEFDSLIQKEREIGKGLINTKTGKVLHERLVEKLLLKQISKLKALNEARLAFIKLRHQVSAKEAHLQSIITHGQNLNLINYEQLQMENQSYADKIEKRDEEIQQMQNKMTSGMHLIANMKEKSFAIDEKMDELSDMLEHTETKLFSAHRYVRDLKKRHDFLRSETLRLCREAGLLTQPHLLQDFAVIVEEATCLSAQVQNLKNSFYDKKQRFAKIRKCIDAHTSVGSVTNTSSGTRLQQRKSHSTNFSVRNFHSKIPNLHSVTSDLINQLSSAEVKPGLRGQYSRFQSKHSFRSSPMIPVSKERATFSQFSYEVSLPKEGKPNLPIIKS